MFKKSMFLVLLIFLILLLSFNVMAEEVTIQFMGWEASPLETEAVQNGINEFMEENPDINVEYTPIPESEYNSRILTMMAGETAPDVFFLGSHVYRDYAERGVLENLTDRVEAEIGIDDFIPSSRTKMLINDEIYGLSSCTVSPVLYYNKEIFDRYNVSYPPANPDEMWDWNEFIDYAKELTIESNGRIQQYGTFGFQNFWWTTVLSNGAEVFNEDYTEIRLNEPKAQEALQKIVDLRKEYGVAPEGNFLEDSGMNSAQMLQTGRVAMVVDGSWALQELAQMPFEVGIAPLPKLEDSITTGQAHLHAIWEGSEHKEEAWKFVKYLSSNEYQLQLVKSGLWMPNREFMYTKEGIKEWFNPDVHPENFVDLAQYFRDARLEVAVMPPQEAWDTLHLEELEKIWFDNQDVVDVTEDLNNTINPLLN
ncbi:MAG: ABC transporter substrate-binding protein [Halanaerobiales bacterium]